MFFPEAMTETELIIPEKELLPVTKVLAGQGIFHQVDASFMSSENDTDAVVSWKERASEYGTLERQIMFTMQALGVEEGAPSTADEDTLIETDLVHPQVNQIEGEVKDTNDLLLAKQNELGQLQNYIKQLEPISGINLDVSVLRNPQYIHSTLGNIPVANIERLETSLSRIPYVLLILRKEQDSAIVWLTGAQLNADILERAARSAYLNPLELSDTFEGAPSEIIKSLGKEIETVKMDIESQEEKLSQLHETYKQQLQTLLWRVRSSRLLADAMARYGRLRYTYLIIGWTPSTKIEALTQQLKGISKNILIETTPLVQRGSNHSVPVALQNTGMFGAFQGLVTTYARPRYEEIDPTILMTLTFPLLFGAMFGDVGHGLLLIFFGWLLSGKRVNMLKGMASLGPIILACGVVASFFGFLYGSLFGSEEFFHELFGFGALWIEPLKEINQILAVAIGAGVVILSLGFLLNIFNAWRARDWGRLIFDHHGVAGLLLYWSLLGIGASALLPAFPVSSIFFVILTIIAAIMVMFSEVFRHLLEGHRPLVEDGIFTYLIQAFVELFETFISSLSNSVSYVRVGAFAVAHGGLSSVIFILANMAGGGNGVLNMIMYWIVVILGNLFIVGFEGLIVGIQTMRLEYYEFFSKFFEGGGMSYEPLTPLAVDRN
jgi:V/A-type H+-transporting ATPase subunit I